MNYRVNFSINRILWFVLIAAVASNIFLISPIYIGETRIPITLLISLFGMFLFSTILKKNMMMKIKLVVADYLLILFLFINLISTLLNSNRFYGNISQNINGFLVLLSGIIYYFFFRATVKNYRETIFLFKVYFFSALIPTIYSILHFLSWNIGHRFFFKLNYDLYYHFYSLGMFRASGFTPEPSHFALYLSSVIFIGLFFLSDKNQKKKKFYSISLLIIITAQLLTFSQILAFDLFFLFWFLIIRKKNIKQFLFILIILTISISSILALDFHYKLGICKIFVKRTQLILSTEIEKGYNLGRFQSLIIGWEIFKRHPILGIGINNLSLETIDTISSIEWHYESTGLHSKLIMILVETGVIGFIIYLFFGFKTFLKKVNIINFIKMPNYISYSFFIVFILTGITGKFLTFFFFWFLAALTVNYFIFIHNK
ncbi:MAG: O-antigen ligase family protein [Cellulophaga sp.]